MELARNGSGFGASPREACEGPRNRLSNSLSIPLEYLPSFNSARRSGGDSLTDLMVPVAIALEARVYASREVQQKFSLELKAPFSGFQRHQKAILPTAPTASFPKVFMSTQTTTSPLGFGPCAVLLSVTALLSSADLSGDKPWIEATSCESEGLFVASCVL